MAHRTIVFLINISQDIEATSDAFEVLSDILRSLSEISC